TGGADRLPMRNLSERRRTPGVERGLALTLGAGLALLLVLGLVFSAAYGSQRITSSATALHSADETLRSATVVRAQLAIAIYTTSVDGAFGTNSGPARDLAISEAQQSLTDIEDGFADLSQGNPEYRDLQAKVDTFVGLGRELTSAVESGAWIRGEELSDVELQRSFQLLSGALVEVRNELAATVAESDRMLGYVGIAGRFLVAFFVPAAIIMMYRELVRRQQRQSELERRLAAERDLAASREKFIANASHELRTPLTGILGMALLLEEDPALQDSDIASELLDMVISEAGDLSRMVDDLLTTARLDSGALHFAFEDCDINEATHEAVATLTRAGLVVDIDTDPGVVRTDKLRLRQVLRNLLSNAQKYGGPHIRVDGHIEGTTYVWSVVDDGAGVTDAVLERLFRPFVHRGEDVAVTDSVGLGLSIVHALVHGMGGDVSHTRMNDETYFTVRLPLASSAKAPAGTTLPEIDAPVSELLGLP
ncbi:MAG: HAMP domain-containing histidine kinase, partial [Acidimicrobiia bacterium]|nr:HAMP domain-containing histidine kinase [Acidimicrobiia bacterium]